MIGGFLFGKPMKSCCKCKQIKDFNEFYKNKNSKDGVVSRCKRCFSEYYSHPDKQEKKKKYNKAYRNTEERKAKVRKYMRDYTMKKRREAGILPRVTKGKYESYGYVYLLKPNHPNANTKGYVREHAFVMSKIKGRPMREKETVHHKNGIRNDNRPENLELWASHHPKGQRVSDVIEFCKKYLLEHDVS